MSSVSFYLLSSFAPTSSYPHLFISPPLHIPTSSYPHLFVSLPASGGICRCHSPWGWSSSRTFLQVLRRHSSEPCRGRSATPHAGCFGEASGKWGGACLLALRGAWHGSPPQAPKASSVNRRESTLGWSSERLPMCLSKCLSVLLLELQADVLIGGGRSHFWVVIGE